VLFQGQPNPPKRLRIANASPNEVTVRVDGPETGVDHYRIRYAPMPNPSNVPEKVHVVDWLRVGRAVFCATAGVNDRSRTQCLLYNRLAVLILIELPRCRRLNIFIMLSMS